MNNLFFDVFKFEWCCQEVVRGFSYYEKFILGTPSPHNLENSPKIEDPILPFPQNSTSPRK